MKFYFTTNNGKNICLEEEKIYGFIIIEIKALFIF